MNDSQVTKIAEDSIELLETLDKENKELKKTLVDVITTMQGQLLGKDNKISKLEKELAELKGDYKFEHS